MRQYTSLDLVQFHKFANEKNLKGMEAIKAYNKEFPELSAKQKLMNLARSLQLKGLYKAVSGVDMPESN